MEVINEKNLAVGHVRMLRPTSINNKQRVCKLLRVGDLFVAHCALYNYLPLICYYNT